MASPVAVARSCSGALLQAASTTLDSAALRRSLLHSIETMWLILLEAAAALVLLLLIVWWTMFSGRKGGERRDDDEARG